MLLQPRQVDVSRPAGEVLMPLGSRVGTDRLRTSPPFRFYMSIGEGYDRSFVMIGAREHHKVWRHVDTEEWPANAFWTNV
jgi:hypothetical protein